MAQEAVCPKELDPSSWLDEHGDALFRFALMRCGDRVAAEDLVQETLLAGIAGRDRFRGDAAVRTWLTGILRNKIADLRRRRDVPQVSIEDDVAAGQIDSQFARSGKWSEPVGRWGSDRDLEDDEMLEALSKCLSRLPERTAAAVVLRERGPLSAEDLGRILGASATNVGVLLFRARTKLRQCLEHTWYRA